MAPVSASPASRIRGRPEMAREECERPAPGILRRVRVVAVARREAALDPPKKTIAPAHERMAGVRVDLDVMVDTEALERGVETRRGLGEDSIASAVARDDRADPAEGCAVPRNRRVERRDDRDLRARGVEQGEPAPDAEPRDADRAAVDLGPAGEPRLDARQLAIGSGRA